MTSYKDLYKRMIRSIIMDLTSRLNIISNRDYYGNDIEIKMSKNEIKFLKKTLGYYNSMWEKVNQK